MMQTLLSSQLSLSPTPDRISALAAFFQESKERHPPCVVLITREDATSLDIQEQPFTEKYIPSSPSFIGNSDEINVRYVNYRVTAKNEYPCDCDFIDTQNAIYNLKEKRITKILHNIVPPRFQSTIRGLEDVRVYTYQGRYFFTATSVFEYQQHQKSVIFGEFPIQSPTVLRTLAWNPSSGFLPVSSAQSNASRDIPELQIRNLQHILSPTQRHSEKNWVYVEESNHHFIYDWCPFRIIQIPQTEGGDGSDLCPKIIKEFQTPLFFRNFHGSSNVMLIKSGPFAGGFLTIAHFSVGWPRTYYHCFVRFDANMKPVAVSEPFVFHSVTIEFCLSARFTADYQFIEALVSKMDKDPILYRMSLDKVLTHHAWIDLDGPTSVQR